MTQKLRTQTFVGWIFSRVTILLGTTLSLACGTPGDRTATPEEIADGMLTMIAFPAIDEPFVSPNLEAGTMPRRGGIDRFQGIDVDLMAAFAASQGVDLEILVLEKPGYGSLIRALIDGRGDVIASAFTITVDRDREVDFSQAYFQVHPVIVSRRDAGIERLEDLVGKTAVGIVGSRQSQRVRTLPGVVAVEEVEFQTEIFADLVDGEADFALMESASARFALRMHPRLEIAFSLPDSESYGVAVREGSRLKPLLDAFLERMDASGEHARILERWLGTSETDVATP